MSNMEFVIPVSIVTIAIIWILNRIKLKPIKIKEDSHRK